MKGCIYQATSPSGKSYIGQTIDTIENRWRDHVYDAITPYKDQCKLLNRAIRKYGIKSFDLKCLEVCDRNKLDEREMHYIAFHDTMKPNGYNLKYGGSSTKHTEETKRKISETLKKRFSDPDRKIMTQNKVKGERLYPLPVGTINNQDVPKKKVHRRIFNELPKYIVRIGGRGKHDHHGYRVEGHPKQNGTKKQFASRQLTLEENLRKTIEYIKELDSLEESLVRETRTLPKYIQYSKHGYRVKCQYGEKFFLSTQKTNQELFNDAVNYLNQLMSAIHLDQGIP